MFFFFNFKHFGSGAPASAGSSGGDGGDLVRNKSTWIRKPKKKRNDTEYTKLTSKSREVVEEVNAKTPPSVAVAIKYIKAAPKLPPTPPRLVTFRHTPLSGYQPQSLVEPIIPLEKEGHTQATEADLVSYSYEDVEAWVTYLAEKKAREEQEILELAAAIQEQERAEKARIDAIIAEFEHLKKEEEDNLEWAMLAMAAGSPKLASIIIGLHD